MPWSWISVSSLLFTSLSPPIRCFLFPSPSVQVRNLLPRFWRSIMDLRIFNVQDFDLLRRLLWRTTCKLGRQCVWTSLRWWFYMDALDINGSYHGWVTRFVAIISPPCHEVADEIEFRCHFYILYSVKSYICEYLQGFPLALAVKKNSTSSKGLSLPYPPPMDDSVSNWTLGCRKEHTSWTQKKKIM